MPRRDHCDTRCRAGDRRGRPMANAASLRSTNVNQTSLRLRSTSTYGASASRSLASAYRQGKVRVEKRLEWLIMFCNLSRRASALLRLLAERDAWLPLGAIVDELRAPPYEVAQLSMPHSALREWGLVRFTM